MRRNRQDRLRRERPLHPLQRARGNPDPKRTRLDPVRRTRRQGPPFRRRRLEPGPICDRRRTRVPRGWRTRPMSNNNGNGNPHATEDEIETLFAQACDAVYELLQALNVSAVPDEKVKRMTTFVVACGMEVIKNDARTAVGAAFALNPEGAPPKSAPGSQSSSSARENRRRRKRRG